MRDVAVIRKIEEAITENLDRLGLFYRVTSRVKTSKSVDEKLAKKEYHPDGDKMQDLYGSRVTVFFFDDVDVVTGMMKDRFGPVIDEQIDELDEDRFAAQRTNLVFQVPLHIEPLCNIANQHECIETTFELQVRTILSEGWHEVDHDFRYKGPDVWKDFSQEERIFNGILATLETSEWSMVTLLDRLAYACYKDERWEDMLALKLRLRGNFEALHPDLRALLNQKDGLAKTFYRIDRSTVLRKLWETELSFPLNVNNLFYFLNAFFIHDKDVAKLCSDFLRNKFESAK